MFPSVSTSTGSPGEALKKGTKKREDNEVGKEKEKEEVDEMKAVISYGIVEVSEVSQESSISNNHTGIVKG